MREKGYSRTSKQLISHHSVKWITTHPCIKHFISKSAVEFLWICFCERIQRKNMSTQINWVDSIVPSDSFRFVELLHTSLSKNMNINTFGFCWFFFRILHVCHYLLSDFKHWYSNLAISQIMKGDGNMSKKVTIIQSVYLPSFRRFVSVPFVRIPCPPTQIIFL